MLSTEALRVNAFSFFWSRDSQLVVLTQMFCVLDTTACWYYCSGARTDQRLARAHSAMSGMFVLELSD